MDSRMVSFWYLPTGATPEYKHKVSEFLQEITPSAKGVMPASIYVGPHESLNPSENPSGLVSSIYFLEVEKPKVDNLETFCEYILSREQKIKPVFVSSNIMRDYGRIEEILKDIYGEKARLTLSLPVFFGFGSERRIRVPRAA